MHDIEAADSSHVRAESEQAMLRQTIAHSGEMIAQAVRLIAASRTEAMQPDTRPTAPPPVT